MKNKKGFTLVELVVVMAIIGVLAAILVPSLMGYIKKSRLKASNANAKIAYNSVTGTLGKYLLSGRTFDPTGIEIDCTGSAPVPSNDFTKKVYASIADNGKGSGILYIGEFSQSSDHKALFIHWIVRRGDTMVGQYPGASSDIDNVPVYKTYWTG